MKKLLLTTLLFSAATAAQDLSWTELNKYTIASEKSYDYSAHAADYMKSFQRAKFDKYHLDEFEFDSKKNETASQMKEMAKAFNLEQLYTINANVWFGQYNFEKGEFPITFTKVPSDVTTENMPAIYPDGLFYNFTPDYPESSSDSFRYNVRVKLKNTDKLSGIKLDKEKAKAFLQSHKSGDRINRSLPITVTVKIKNVALNDQSNDVSDADVEITKAVIFSDDKRNKILSQQDLNK